MSGVESASSALLALADAAPRDVSIFSPASPAAESIVSLSWLVFAVAALIFVVVEVVLFYTIWRFRHAKQAGEPGEPPQVYGSNPIEIAWTVAPTMIVFFLVLVTTRTLWEVNAAPIPSNANGDARGVLEVTVIARQWWWEYQYRSYDGRQLEFITANELHIPIGDAEHTRATRLTLESADVCHSFWVPRLEGKVDAIPGHTNTLWLQTREAGLYLGQCAEFCGTQHAHMLLRVVAQPPDEFEAWLSAQAKPAVEDGAVADGKAAFLAESCVNCHRVRGTSANGNYGPDLTHLMSRQTLAAGMIALDAETLPRWIHDPQQIKPGCLMPAFGLDAEREALIVKYLLSLQ